MTIPAHPPEAVVTWFAGQLLHLQTPVATSAVWSEGMGHGGHWQAPAASRVWPAMHFGTQAEAHPARRSEVEAQGGQKSWGEPGPPKGLDDDGESSGQSEREVMPPPAGAGPPIQVAAGGVVKVAEGPAERGSGTKRRRKSRRCMRWLRGG